jgi:hypothetical protein
LPEIAEQRAGQGTGRRQEEDLENASHEWSASEKLQRKENTLDFSNCWLFRLPPSGIHANYLQLIKEEQLCTSPLSGAHENPPEPYGTEQAHLSLQLPSLTIILLSEHWFNWSQIHRSLTLDQ